MLCSRSSFERSQGFDRRREETQRPQGDQQSHGVGGKRPGEVLPDKWASTLTAKSSSFLGASGEAAAAFGGDGGLIGTLPNRGDLNEVIDLAGSVDESATE
jgi:hypothetical protein